MALDKYELIRRYMKSRLGAPIVELCETEVCAIDEAVEAAATRYWLALPYQTTDDFTISISCDEIKKDIDSIKDKAFGTNVLKDDAYFLGIGRYDLSDIYDTDVIGTNYFDQKLLGRQFGHHPGNFPTQDPRFLADRVLAESSTSDLLFGELDYRHDIVNNEIVFITPPIQGVAHIWYNWGFCPTKTIQLLPMVHFDVFKKMVTFEFLETVIPARTTLSLSSADYQIDATDLIKKRDSLEEEIKKELSDLAIIPGVWG